MTIRKMTEFFLTATFFCLTLCSVSTGWAQGQVAADLEKRGRVALEAGDLPAAAKIFSEGSSLAVDPEIKARLDFRQAVALQQMAGKPEVQNPQEQLRQAAGLYQSYLAVHPESAAAANNLAKIYEQMGDELLKSPNPERARRPFTMAAKNYQKAVSAADSRQGFYMKNYSELLEKMGEWRRAKELYVQLIQNHPISPALMQSMAESYSNHGLGEIAGLTWNLLDAGYVRQSIEISLEAIRNSRDDFDESRVELLTVVCAGLAEGTGDFRQFSDSETGLQLQGLTADTLLGEGVNEVVRLYQVQEFDPSQYRWWADRGSPRGDPDRGLWPVDGFRALIRSLGSRAKQSGNLSLAERYFRLAADLREWETDPVAVRALVQMYAEQDAYGRIDGVLEDYQVQLFEGKGGAYRESRVEKIFQYHQTLGELYALIERWGNSSRVDSAIFQLEHAREKSIMLEDSTSKALPEKYQFTPQMVDSLAIGYERTGQVSRVTELRIDQAERYQKAGNIKATQRVLAPVKAIEVPSSLQSRYQNLNVNPEIRAPVRNLELQRAPITQKEDSGG